MRHFWKSISFAAALAGAAAMPATSYAAVAVGVSIGGPSFFYGAGFYPPGPCDAFDYYYSGYCGYPVFAGPIFIDGLWVSGPHYYRWWGGQPVFWYRGGWHNWAGWRHARVRWSHAAGWGWRNGHWNRAWGPRYGNAHFRSIAHWQGHPGVHRAAHMTRATHFRGHVHNIARHRAAHWRGHTRHIARHHAMHFRGRPHAIRFHRATHFPGHMRAISRHGGMHWRGHTRAIGFRSHAHFGGHRSFGGRARGGGHFGGGGHRGGGRRGH